MQVRHLSPPFRMKAFWQRVLVAAVLAQPGMATMQHVQSQLVAGGVVNIDTAIEALKSEGKVVCLTLDAHFELGGLANTLGIVNTVLDFALRHDLHWFLPEIRPPAHETGDAFRYMFGKPERCDARKIPYYIVTCPFQFLERSGPRELPQGHCALDDTQVHQNTRYSFSRCQPNCTSVLAVSSIIDWVFNYSTTGPILADKYWKRRASLGENVSDELHFPLATAVHLRLGDVAGSGSSKEFNAGSFEKFSSALTSMIDPKCLKVDLHTDSNETDDVVQQEKASWISKGVAEVQIYDVTTEEIESFNRMSSADILIGGASGFSRLSAVLGRASVKLFANDYSNSHPIEGMRGVTTVPWEYEQSDVVSGLAMNRQMNTVIAACKAWLEG